MKRALLVIDMLNDFVLEGAPLEVPNNRRMLPALRRRIEEARRTGVPVVYICDAHAPDDPEFASWSPHAVKGSDGAQVVAELSPAAGEAVVSKNTYFSFYGTRLDELLKGLGAEELVLTGCVTNICILYGAAEAVVRGYKVVVPVDCVADLDEQEGRFALDQMRKVLGVVLQ